MFTSQGRLPIKHATGFFTVSTVNAHRCFDLPYQHFYCLQLCINRRL